MDGSFPMPPTITQDWVPSRADINKLIRLKYYQAHNEFIPTATVSALDPDANRLDISLSGSYPVKVSALKDLEIHSRDMIRILSHAVEEPPPLRNTEVQSPLPLPLPNIPVEGRLAHFAQNWAKITDDECRVATSSGKQGKQGKW